MEKKIDAKTFNQCWTETSTANSSSLMNDETNSDFSIQTDETTQSTNVLFSDSVAPPLTKQKCLPKMTQKNKKKAILTTKYVTYVAILVAINAVLNLFSVSLSIGTIKVSFTYIPCFVAGMFLGPFAGLLVGLLGDLIGLANGDGAVIPLILLGSTLIGLIPGIIFKFIKANPMFKLALSLVCVFGICTMGINTAGIYYAFIKGRKAYEVFALGRLISQGPILGINSAVLFLLYYPLKRLVFKKDCQFVSKPKQIPINEEIKPLIANAQIVKINKK